MPIGFVSTSASPGCNPALRISAPRSTSPFIANPSDNSAPSLVWPPTSAQPASRSTVFAPAIISERSASTLSSSPYGTVAMASAVNGSPPIANRSPSAWLAAIMPNRYGSSMMARK